MIQGDFVSLNPATIRKVATRVDHYEVPYFLVVYMNGDCECFSIREAFVENISCTTDSKLCVEINNTFFTN